jgi:L-lactate dehydrogenase complex protein LldG
LDLLERALADIRRVIRDEEFQVGVKKASSHAEEKVPAILEKYPYIRELAREVERVKKEVIANLDYYIDETINSMKRAGMKTYIALTAKDAREYIGSLVGSGKVIVLSKSMTAEEVGLREYLESLGNEVWETDLGQLLVQLEGSKPMHSVAPAIHLTRRRVAALLKSRLGFEVSEDASPEEMVRLVRNFLRSKFVRADVGISGANAIAADTGSIVLVENEGNIRLVTGLPPLHVVIAGVEKIVPTLMDALRVAMVQAAYDGLYPPNYINVITGPSATADIEHKRVYGAHGPLEVHVVLLDNGRRRARLDPILRDQLRCIRCGRCQWECPLWHHTANYWGGPTYGGPMGVVWTAITQGVEVASGLAMLCLGCRRCDFVCPVEIPLSRILHNLKREYVKRLLHGGSGRSA